MELYSHSLDVGVPILMVVSTILKQPVNWKCVLTPTPAFKWEHVSRDTIMGNGAYAKIRVSYQLGLAAFLIILLCLLFLYYIIGFTHLKILSFGLLV